VLKNSYYKENVDPGDVRDKASLTDIMKKTDDELVKIFGVRSKEDLRIRRMRMTDIFKHYIRCGYQDKLIARLHIFSRLDYITVCNLLNATLIHPEYFLNILLKLDAFKSLTRYSVVTNTINQLVKKYPCSMEFRLTMAEASNLTGYRGLPFPGFDPVAATKDLCDGGDEHGLKNRDWLTTFETAARRVIFGQKVKTVDYMSMADFIKSDLAETSGASSRGKVEYEFEGETEKFKARKNFLLDIFAPSDIYEKTYMDLGKQTSSAFVKPELGKCRIAVTGDISTYYSMSWLNYLCGHSYTSWTNNTLEENRIKQLKRMEKMTRDLKGRYSLPFDYKGFDHQPTLEEIKILVRLYLESGRANVPDARLTEWQDILDKTVISFENNECYIWVDGIKNTFHVKGGVQSGIRLTTLLGNFWNQVMSEVARNLCDPFEDKISDIYIRGDDSSIYADDYFSCLLMRLAYQGINAVGHDAKYGIHFQNSEFLRVWYNEKRVFGYPNRSIPGLVQRKPWNSDPWSPDSVTAALFDTVNTIERRLGNDMNEFRKTVSNIWQQIRKLDRRYLELPKQLGGLGLLPWNGYLPDKPYPHVEKVKVKFKTASGSLQRYIDRYKEYILLDDIQAQELQQETMLSKASSDDIPGMNRILRQKFKTLLDKHGTVKWSKEPEMISYASSAILATGLLRKLDEVSDISAYDMTTPVAFGFFRRYEKMWTDVSLLSKITDIKPMQYMRIHAPEFVNYINRIERKGWHRANALDYAFGKVTGLYVDNLHPTAYRTIECATAKVIEMSQTVKQTRQQLLWLIQTASKSATSYLKQSKVYNKLFLW